MSARAGSCHCLLTTVRVCCWPADAGCLMIAIWWLTSLLCMRCLLVLSLVLYQNLGDIEVAMKLLKQDGASDDSDHPIDRHYKQLACDIQALDKTDPTVQLVKDYVERTHGQTHRTFGLEVDEVRRDCPLRTARLSDQHTAHYFLPLPSCPALLCCAVLRRRAGVRAGPTRRA